MKQFKWMAPLAALALLAGSVSAQPDTTSNTNQMTNACQNMMQMRQQMREQVKAQDQELKRLADDMNAAPAAGKVDAMVLVVNKLVQDRLATHQMMETNMFMMHHMMRHMGGTNCPAWGGMKGGMKGGTE